MNTTQSTQTASTTYTKLRDGSWGIRGSAALRAGQSVTVVKRDGSSKVERIGRVLWTGNGVALATIESGSAPSRSTSRFGRSSSRWTGCSCGSREDFPRDSDCASCRFDNE